ncbi:MAG: alpha-L-fucosidase [Pontiellaceae bacterium]|nr:alpha-L-fucosidase [Pontiellaceae bacterium]MBN2785700.1 alpha-L-fucosidase [Pontiellaceae bacterium]
MTDSRTKIITLLILFTAPFAVSVHAESIPIDATPSVLVNTQLEPVVEGKFEPVWESLQQYETPEWFRDAKFGIWAHWGPQCQPEAGDWYARQMYLKGDWKHKFHLEHYGDPAQFGFKDVIHEWKADQWDPARLVNLYKRAGARYFFAMANHHDNLDMWASKYQPWNSAAVGPKKNIIAGWAAAARDNDLPFGVSVHAAHAWSWYEPAQDFDGKLTKADGAGTWWEDLDPQDLYEQRHTPSSDYQNGGSIHARWNWGNGVTQPDQAYCQKFYNRTMDLINSCQPELIYFDDTALPLWPVSDAGLKLAAHFYNSNLKKTDGASNGVLFGKILNEEQKKALTWDVERGVPAEIVYPAWQTCTCIGGWHYDRGLYERGGYKSARTVIHMLADIVSKNGNLLLNIPVRGDGSIDEKEEAVLNGITEWMDVNSECIYATRPWKVFGEGPASEGAALSAQGFNEGKGKPFTAEDIRYTASKDGKTLYAIVMGWPAKPVVFHTVSSPEKAVEKVELLGSKERMRWTQNAADALVIETIPSKPDSEAAAAAVFKIKLTEING